MSRRRAREYALQLLFQLELTGAELNQEVLEDFWDGRKEGNDVKQFTNSIVRGTSEKMASLDNTISKAAKNWQLERMAIVDKSILRISAYELLYRQDIPPSVTINEAIEISRKYSTEESASFINGILDKIAGVADIDD